MKRKVYTKREIDKILARIKYWRTNPKGTTLTQTRLFKTHIDALAFVARITVLAQVSNHYPDILLTERSVKVSLSTPDVKALTKKDLELAEKINNIPGGG